MSIRSARAVLVGSAILAGGALASSAGAAPYRTGTSIAVVGGNPAQRELARITAKRVGAATIARVSFRAPIGELRHAHVHGTEMIVSSRGGQTLRAIWDQQLFIGTYLGLMQRWRGAGIAGAASRETEGTVGRLRPYDVLASNPKAIEGAVLTHDVVDASVRGRARVIDLQTIATPARLIALTVRVSDPAAFLKHRVTRLLDLLWHPPVPLLGYYVGVEDSTGALVFATSHLPNTGGLFVTPALDSCSPIGHGDAITWTRPPPCPAR